MVLAPKLISVAEPMLSMETLYEKSHKRIYDFLYKYTQNADTAMDLMQDTYLNFFRAYKLAGLDEEKSIMVLYRIARNLSINFSKKFSNVKESSSQEMHLHSHDPSIEKKVVLRDLEERIYKCLNELKEDEKTALLLKNIENFNLTQIAEVLDISVSTASRLVIRAQEKLLKIAEKKGLVPE